MPSIGNTYATLLDVAKRLDPDGRVALVGEVLSQTDEMVEVMNFREANMPLGNRVTLRTSLPTPSRRFVNRGVKRGKSTTEQFVDTIEMNELYIDTDVRAILPGVSVDQYRWSEDMAAIAGFTKQVARDLLYGNEASEPGSFTGLAPRYGSLSGKYKDQIVDAGGTGWTNTSLYLVTTGDEHTSCVYPIGAKAGLDIRNLGEQRVYDKNGDPFQAFSTLFKWDIGLSIKEYRSNARLANIDVSALANAGKAGYTGPDLPNLIIDLLGKVRGNKLGKRFLFANPTLATAIRKLALTKASGNIAIDEFCGRKVAFIDNIPVMTEEAILNTEDRVV